VWSLLPTKLRVWLQKKEVKLLPNIKSAIKRVKVTAKRTARNNRIRSMVRTAVKRFNTSLDTKAENTNETLVRAVSQIDKAASKGVLHKNTAARKKSRLMKRLNAQQAQ
jgi:small subunit ribosomal protein S20